MLLKDIVFREDLYPRFNPNQKAIQQYSESLENLPPIKVNQNNILVDGFHRWKAFELKERKEIPHEIIQTKSEKELKKLAYQLNSNHGLQLSNKEKCKYAQEMISEMTIEELSVVLSVPCRTIRDWTENQRKALEEERNRRILEMYLRAWNTQQSIADEMGIPQRTVADIIAKFSGNGEIANSAKNFDFKPFIYNIWSLAKQDTTTDYFGAFPQPFMENLLYYYTDPFDIVFDPFAGTGTMVDACRKMFRRYYCSDLKILPGREKDIKPWDIAKGLPDDLPRPRFAFLDPPYWKQAKGRYSKHENDLGNMSLEKFNETIGNLLDALTRKKVEMISVVIQPTQYSNDFDFVDHIFDFHEMLSKKYKILMRQILPYSTEQYNAQMVEKAKQKKVVLALNRDLVVWKAR